jgi:hypothetical protein
MGGESGDSRDPRFSRIFQSSGLGKRCLPNWWTKISPNCPDSVWTILAGVSKQLSTQCVDNSGTDVNDKTTDQRGLRGLAGIWTNET